MGEQLWTLLVIPGSMQPPDCVVVGDGAAGGDDSIRCRLFDLGVHFQLGSQATHALKGEVGCWAVGINVGEAA